MIWTFAWGNFSNWTSLNFNWIAARLTMCTSYGELHSNKFSCEFLSIVIVILKYKFVFLHFKPNDQDIYNQIRHSAALLWWTAQSWELGLIADVTTGWKKRRFRDTSSVSTICRKNRFKGRDSQRMFSGVLSHTDTKTLSWTTALNLGTAHFSCFRRQTNSRFRLVRRCLTSCFSVRTREDTTEHSVFVSSF